MIDNLSCQNLSPSLPLCVSVFLPTVFVGISVYISMFPPMITSFVHNVSKSLDWPHCQLSGGTFVKKQFLVWCHGSKEIAKSATCNALQVWHQRFEL